LIEAGNGGSGSVAKTSSARTLFRPSEMVKNKECISHSIYLKPKFYIFMVSTLSAL
jgi:hypothetical protein